MKLLLLTFLGSAVALDEGKWGLPRAPWSFECEAGSSISSVSSFGARVGSLFKFQCAPFADGSSVKGKLVKQPFAIKLDGAKGQQDMGNPGSNCLQGYALVGFEGKVDGGEQKLRAVCAQTDLVVDEEVGCVLRELNPGTSARQTAAVPVNPTGPCASAKFAAWGFQLGEGGKLLIKWCPVKKERENVPPECKEVTEEETTVSEFAGYEEIIETEVTEEEVVEVTNLEEVEEKAEEYKEEQEEKAANGEPTDKELQDKLVQEVEDGNEKVEELLETTCEGSDESGEVVTEEREEFTETVIEETSETVIEEEETEEYETEEGEEEGAEEEEETEEEETEEGEEGEEEEEEDEEEEGGSGDKCLCVCANSCGAGGEGEDEEEEVRAKRSADTFLDAILDRTKRQTRKTKKTTRRVTKKTITRRTVKKTTTMSSKVSFELEKTETEDGKTAFLMILEEDMELCPEDQCQCDECNACGEAEEEEEENEESESGSGSGSKSKSKKSKSKSSKSKSKKKSKKGKGKSSKSKSKKKSKKGSNKSKS